MAVFFQYFCTVDKKMKSDFLNKYSNIHIGAMQENEIRKTGWL